MTQPEAAPNPRALNEEGIRAAQQGDFDRSIALFRDALTADPTLQLARHNLVGSAALKTQALAQSDRIDEATESFVGLLGEVGPSAETRRVAASVLVMLGKRWQPRNAGMTLTLARRAAALLPEDGNYRTNLENLLHATGQPGKLADYSRAITEAELGRHVFIACFPKSGSSFLKNLLNKLTGYPDQFMTYAFFQNEQELYLPFLLDSAKRDTVTQQHVRPTVSNLHLFQAFQIRPIILVRNIYDVLLSWKEFLDGGAQINTFYPDFAALPEETRFDAVVADRLTWYLSFFAGWRRVTDVETLWLTYEALTSDTPAALKRISDFHKLGRVDVEIEAAIEAVSGNKAGNRFNKGVAGRGAAAFSDAQKARIRAATEFYPGIDFSMIGL